MTRLGSGPGLVRLDHPSDGVAVITLDDAAHRNALRFAMTQALGTAVHEALEGGARAIVLAAEPPVFCAGGSLDELLEPVATLPEIYEGMLALARAPVPTIAAVGGPAIGAGVNLPLFCDVIVASPSARFDPRWLDVGIHPGGGHLFRLADRVGRQAAAALVLLGEVADGEQAADIGLAWRCVPDADLLPTAVALAERAAGRDGALVRRTKATLDASRTAGDADAARAIELEAQEWSMARPEFTAGLERLRNRR